MRVSSIISTSSSSGMEHLGYGYRCHVCALRLYSHGNVFLKSAGPLADSSMDPEFLSDSRDLVTMIAGAK
ncbi:MAG: hypothetical protein ACI9ND_001479 [Yoonia sp.]|jgi:hypothetical protein